MQLFYIGFCNLLYLISTSHFVSPIFGQKFRPIFNRFFNSNSCLKISAEKTENQSNRICRYPAKKIEPVTETLAPPAAVPRDVGLDHDAAASLRRQPQHGGVRTLAAHQPRQGVAAGERRRSRVKCL